MYVETGRRAFCCRQSHTQSGFTLGADTSDNCIEKYLITTMIILVEYHKSLGENFTNHVRLLHLNYHAILNCGSSLFLALNTGLY